MTHLAIRWRLTLWYGVALLVVLTIFGGCCFWLMREHLIERTDRELDEELAEVVQEISFTSDEPQMIEHLQQRFGVHKMFQFQVSTFAGDVVFRSERLAQADERLPLPRLDMDQAVYSNFTSKGFPDVRLASERTRGPAGDLVVQVMTPLDVYREEQTHLLAMFFTVGPLALVAALAGGYLLALSALSPLARMVATVEQINAECIEQRIDVANPDDELGRLARTLNRMLDRLQFAIDGMRRFCADAAHELRTPLSVLRTEAEVVLRSPRDADSYRQAIEVSLQEIERLSRMTEQLLALSREDANVTPPDFDEVRLDALLRDVVEGLQAKAIAQQVEVNVLSLRECAVQGDDVRLSRLFYNLLDNAIKNTLPGGRVSVSMALDESVARVVIDDTGVGIPAEQLSKVFDRFYRVDESRSSTTGGAGLGLSICQAIAERHHGRVELSSVVGTGTRAVVILPCQACQRQ
ncbi:MAG TPA: ATP-binding protein [Pirellulales bacterium]|nr:ATP-binding protein [Pirellulales bacterium]